MKAAVQFGTQIVARSPLSVGKVMSLPTVTLGVSEIRTTHLGFGCAGLFHASSRTSRSGLLHTAYDAGIRHFDVAPMYGLGRAEHELGTFARMRRSELTIATKFGIKPTLLARGIGRAQGPIRRIFAAKPAIRDYARAPGRPNGHLYEQGEHDAVFAKRSLEHSLRALGTDYIDLFLIHEPLPGSVRSDEISSCLEDARTAGWIRAWGIAGEPESTDEVARSFQVDIPIRQLRDYIFLRSLRFMPPGPSFITYGVIVPALASLVKYVTADDYRRRQWKKAIGEDCGNPEVAASFLFRAAFRANSSGVVLFSATQPLHMQAAVAALEVFRSHADEGLEAFLRMVYTEFQKEPLVGRGRS
jgi:D-threo-aldose 1-dehydrogenase